MCHTQGYFLGPLLFLLNTMFYQIVLSGESREGTWGAQLPGLPCLFLDQTELRPKGPKKIFWRPEPHLSKGVDNQVRSLSHGLDPALVLVSFPC